MMNSAPPTGTAAKSPAPHAGVVGMLDRDNIAGSMPLSPMTNMISKFTSDGTGTDVKQEDDTAGHRPRGRPPKNTVWDMDTGKYVVDKALTEKPKKRKNQDPNRPRRAMSSFLYYARQKRPELIKTGLTFVDAQRRMAEEWKAMSKEERQPFEDIAEMERQRYKEQMETYTPEEENQDDAVDTKVDDPNRPKRPPSSFLLFCKQNRARVKEQVNQAQVTAKNLAAMESPSGAPPSSDTKKKKGDSNAVHMQDVQRILATEWKNMADDLKQVYHDQHKALRVTFNNEKKIYDQMKEKEAEARRKEKEAAAQAQAASAGQLDAQSLMEQQQQLYWLQQQQALQHALSDGSLSQSSQKQGNSSGVSPSPLQRGQSLLLLPNTPFGMIPQTPNNASTPVTSQPGTSLTSARRDSLASPRSPASADEAENEEAYIQQLQQYHHLLYVQLQMAQAQMAQGGGGPDAAQHVYAIQVQLMQVHIELQKRLGAQTPMPSTSVQQRSQHSDKQPPPSFQLTGSPLPSPSNSEASSTVSARRDAGSVSSINGGNGRSNKRARSSKN
eukprot:m.14805 g.14805  ORF g.14805 m.14805 type:complete len:555 (-) comp10534_c0_seq2:457-2121(-)